MKKSKEPKKYGAVKSLLFGVVLAYALSVAAIVVFAWILYSTSVSEDFSNTVILIITLVSTFFAGLLCARLKKSGGLLFGALTGAVYFVILYIVAFAVGVRPVGIPALSTAVFGCLSAAVGGILGVNIKK